MRKKDSKRPRKNQPSTPTTESLYAKRRRRRAERITRATGAYTDAFRADVRFALDNDPSQLPRLFAYAEFLDQFAEDQKRKACQAKGSCLQELLADHEEYIQQRGFEMVRLLSDTDPAKNRRRNVLATALVELSNATSVHYFHPQVVESFFRQAVTEAIENGKDGRPDSRSQQVLNDIHILLSQFTPQRIVEEITESYNDSSREPSPEYRALCASSNADRREPEQTRDDWGREIEADPELERVRRQLMRLERLPENEAIRFQLETEIYRLERQAQADGDWSDVIG